MAGDQTTAMHASAPPGHKCADCTIDHEPCPTCYAVWWRRRHPHVHTTESEAEPFDWAALQQIRKISP